MGILDNVTRNNQGNGKTGTTEGKREERVPSKIWLNVGVPVTIDGEVVFVSLPSGLPIDDMKQKKVSGGIDYANLMQCKNGLLEELQKLGSKLAPGERRIVPLEVEIYRVAEEQSATGDASDNPLLAAMFGQLGGNKG